MRLSIIDLAKRAFQVHGDLRSAGRAGAVPARVRTAPRPPVVLFLLQLA
jgi:hypothetical protein